MVGTYCGDTEFHDTIYSPVNGSLHLEFETDDGNLLESDASSIENHGFRAVVRAVRKFSFPLVHGCSFAPAKTSHEAPSLASGICK